MRLYTNLAVLFLAAFTVSPVLSTPGNENPFPKGDLTEQRPQLRKGRYRPAGKNPVFAPGPEVGSRKLVGSNSKPTAKAQATTGTGSGDSAGVSKPPVPEPENDDGSGRSLSGLGKRGFAPEDVVNIISRMLDELD